MTFDESTSSFGAMIMLTDTNYTLWKPRMEDFLSCKDLFDPIEMKGINPDPAKSTEWKKINRKTVVQIRQWIDHSVFHHVAQETDALNSPVVPPRVFSSSRSAQLTLKFFLPLVLSSAKGFN
ncbi:unnamed protein product [Cuscuta epithymum]|uniref:Retrotransposon Copia-like N-terminal domain-containing protein n=1 Tax=Cuscuta epithymum TaxID=186058 RepID=A0AAV0FNQ7_9ASTE|nr:unnamed protein product [Cuscuta epithymum]